MKSQSFPGNSSLDRRNVEVKIEEISGKGSIDLRLGDEALRLVDAEKIAEFDEEYNLELRKKLDWVIPPICASVYFSQYLDKTSLNYASVMGFPITGQHYNLASMAFYLGFLTWVFPTTYIAQKSRVAKYLGVNIVLWGIILMLHSVANSFGAFFALRFLLGMCESCVAPILILVISMFYKKNEHARRISWFYVMNGLTMVFGGFVAYGISFYDGHRIASWKIIYILLGGLAIVVGTGVLIWLPDSPLHAQFLTHEERTAVLERVRGDQVGVENKVIKSYQIKEALLDIRTWLIVLSTLLASVPNGGITNFSNIIIKNFGYTTKQTLILSTPGGVVSAAMTLFCGWFSDKKNERMIPIVIANLPTILGTALLVGFNGTGHKGILLLGRNLLVFRNFPGANILSLVAIYLTGSYGSSLSTIYAYNASNTSGHTKKSTINAITLVAFSVGNIIGAEIFLPKDAPDYVPGKITILVLFSVQLVVVFLLRWINQRTSKKKLAHVEVIKRQRGWTDEDIQGEKNKYAFADLTDKENPYFLYTP
ncbi:hypothetical protein Ac2012v2_001005 [Leucoagaricus gongylophorus]